VGAISGSRPATWLVKSRTLIGPNDERARDRRLPLPTLLLSDFSFAQMTVRGARIKPLHSSKMGASSPSSETRHPGLHFFLTPSWLQSRLARTKRTDLSIAQTVAPLAHTISMLADGLPSLRPMKLPSRLSRYFSPTPLPLLTIIVSQMVPYEGLRCSWCRFLHRCVSGTCRSPYLTAH
jgi:hypothetical protein